MKSNKQKHPTRAILALAALAGGLATAPLSGAIVSYAPGDLIVGFQATGGQGSSETFVFNLGSATTFRDNANVGSVFNVSSQLTSLYGENWFARTDLYWGVVGNSTNNPYAPPVNGDPTRTVYVSRASSGVGNSTPWTGYGPALGTASTMIQSFLTGESGGFNSRTAEAGTDGRGAIVSTSLFNSWAVYNPQPGASFSIFSGGIEGSFGTEGSYSYLDIYRILATSDGANPAGPVGDGMWITTLTIDSSGNMAAVPEPATAAVLIGAAALGLAGFIRRRRR